MKTVNGKLVVEVPLKKGQTLSDVKKIYPLPSGGIFHKKIPGIGATHGEINAPRNSIIVLPNRPVIESKEAKHNRKHSEDRQIIKLVKGVAPEKVIAYMNNNSIVYKKILLTPESYVRLKKAIGEGWDDVMKQYYLLIDECERSIQDKDYRDKISAPFDDFFNFAEKGLISATTLPFSDPRFESLVHYYIKPMFSYRKQLTLCETNNVVAAFKEYLDITKSKHYFIFLSSISAITAFIDVLGIASESKIHCSENKAPSLKRRGYKSADVLDTKKGLEKYNFLTSRFYSGLDIDLGYKADVLMITEVIFAEHSILDPLTEVIQIVGRFRKGTNSITHITNFNAQLTCRDEGEALIYMEGQQNVYQQIMTLKSKLASEGSQGAIQDIVKNTKFCRYFNPDGSYNYFMLDNYIQEQRVLGLYQSIHNLLTGYALVADHFKVKRVTKLYTLTDGDRLKRQSAENRKAEIKVVVEQLKQQYPEWPNYSIPSTELLDELSREYPEVVKAFHAIGEAGIIKADYSELRMNRAVSNAKDEAKYFQPEILNEVYSKFKVSKPGTKPYTNMYIESTLQDIYDRKNLKVEASAADIKKYFKPFQTTTTIDGAQHHAFRLLAIIDH